MPETTEHLGDPLESWQRDKDGAFFTTCLRNPPSPMRDISLPEYGRVRNARLTFSIEVLDTADSFHCAVLFRKNDRKYIGFSLGGWQGKYGVFQRTMNFLQYLPPIGDYREIRKGQRYEFAVEVRSSHIVSFRANNEALFPYQGVSLRDSLGSTLRGGSIGLYSYGDTRARVKLAVEKLENRCFIITNIDAETTLRRRRWEPYLRDAHITDISFWDARDLDRDRMMMGKIVGAMRISDMVIVDLGHGKPRPNVFYETGVAHALGVPTIHLGPKRSAFARTVPSDLRANFFILEEEIPAKLPSTIGSILETDSGEFQYLAVPS